MWVVLFFIIIVIVGGICRVMYVVSLRFRSFVVISESYGGYNGESKSCCLNVE